MAIILFIAFGFKVIEKFKSVNNIRLKCIYMAYACGDCYPNHKITKIVNGPSSIDLINKEINVEFAEKELEVKFDKEVKNCAICYDYEFFGDLEYSIFDGYYTLSIKEYNLWMDQKCCNTE